MLTPEEAIEQGALTVADLAAWRREPGVAHVLIDVRETWEVEAASIPGAIHVPMQRVPAEIGARAVDDRPIVIVCHHGGRSHMVTEWMRANGFERAVNLLGGVDAWSIEIDPTVPRY